MPIESLNLQILIPKSYEAENYINAYRNISKNTREIEFILNSREADNSYKKVNSANNIGNSNMLVINDDYRRERKNNYSRREDSSKKDDISNDDNTTEGIGKNINIKI